MPASIESEAGFRVLFECATIGILVINEKGSIELSNPCAEKLFDYNPDELLGKLIETLIPDSLHHKHVQHRDEYFAKPNARPMGLGIELFAKKKDGEIFPVEISLGNYELNGDKLAVAFITDITVQVRAKKIVAEREALFRNMANNAPIMIWVSGPDKMRTYFNNAWVDFTGRTMEQELGYGWADDVHPGDKDRCLSIYDEAFDLRQPYTTEYRLRRHDGHYRWVFGTGKPTFTPENLFTGYIGACYEIHNQKIANEELELQVKERTTQLSNALGREKEMNELKSRFVSMASHEFRTPLSIILSSTSLVEQYVGLGTDERIKRHLLRIRSSVSNLNSILNDFLSLDKLEQGKVDLEKESFDFNNFVHEVIEGVQLLQKKGQIVSADHKGDVNVFLDQKKLRYILVNLISNSIKYSAEGSEIHLKSLSNSNRLIISVQDHGIGIPVEEQNHMFDKFFRAKNTGSVEGTGLGLTIAKRYVELMDGDISFVSKDGVGTTFFIKIPLE